MDILSITGQVLFTAEVSKIKDLVIAAVKDRADLRNANLGGADLGGADLGGADLRNAYLGGADLGGTKKLDVALAQIQFIPEEGSFIGWKKCKGGVIVKLSIPAKAFRSHGSERKCRASFVKVLEVIGADMGISNHDGKTEYRKGETIKADSWDENRWNVCAPGIHFFLTKTEAENYTF